MDADILNSRSIVWNAVDHWFCIGSALVLHRFCIGSALVLHWFCIGSASRFIPRRTHDARCSTFNSSQAHVMLLGVSVGSAERLRLSVSICDQSSSLCLGNDCLVAYINVAPSQLTVMSCSRRVTGSNYFIVLCRCFSTLMCFKRKQSTDIPHDTSQLGRHAQLG